MADLFFILELNRIGVHTIYTGDGKMQHLWEMRTYEANTALVSAKFIDPTTGNPHDFSSALSIRMTWHSHPSRVAGTPIDADRDHPSADWSNGFVVFELNEDNITGQHGRYKTAIDVAMNGELVSYGPYTVDVIQRTGVRMTRKMTGAIDIVTALEGLFDGHYQVAGEIASAVEVSGDFPTTP